MNEHEKTLKRKLRGKLIKAAYDTFVLMGALYLLFEHLEQFLK